MRKPNEFKDARDAQEAVTLAEKTFEKQKRQEYDWQNYGDFLQYHRDKRNELRQAELDVLVLDRVCHICNGQKIGSRSWVVIKRKDLKPNVRKFCRGVKDAICRSCYFLHVKDHLR